MTTTKQNVEDCIAAFNTLTKVTELDCTDTSVTYALGRSLESIGRVVKAFGKTERTILKEMVKLNPDGSLRRVVVANEGEPNEKRDYAWKSGFSMDNLNDRKLDEMEDVVDVDVHLVKLSVALDAIKGFNASHLSRILWVFEDDMGTTPKK